MATDASPPPARKSPGPQPASDPPEDDAPPLPAGYIFICSGETRPECFRYRVLGLPRGRLDAVSRIRRGAALFLYDFHAKYLYGPYRADSDGGLALEPAAFQGRYPAQVKFVIDGDFMPIPESSVRSAISENYSRGKFWPELTFTQVEKLRALFRPIALSPVSEAPPPHYVDNRHPTQSAAFLPPSASYPTQPASYVYPPSTYAPPQAAPLVPNNPYPRPDSHLPLTAQYTVPAYYATTTAYPYQAGYQAYGPPPATYHYAQAPPLQYGYAQAQHYVPSSDPYYAANQNDPYRFDAVKAHYQETTSGRAAYGVPHEAAATNLQLVRHYGYAPGSEGATGGTTPQPSAYGAAPAIDSFPGAPATSQAVPLVHAAAAAPAYL
ncbi:leucine-rich repeat extensin-like protein 1 [Hordeum vulgare subsp. vulgare]|uniref:DCD domain-containing protein n=1 Tax=Hordeum vulgare subsp. vulgare TaxID=112509 RepID=A0A8I6XYW7_HORVV|nr:leucine-rich repeat extensin-like protein 1 [Hordeum vulgare subsp. vulgare]